VLFVYAKATQGVAYKDSMFATYWDQLGALSVSQKVYRGAYHFLTAADSSTAQAGRFVDYVELHGGFKADDMPPCLDLEWDRTSTNPDRWKGQSPDDILQKALDWLKEVQRRTNRKPMVYTALSWWHDRGLPVEKIQLFKDYPIWVADYSRSHKASEQPSIIGGRKQDIWQFAEDARLTTGYPGGSLDANIYDGSLDQFRKDFNLPPS
jgi:lysozyme